MNRLSRYILLLGFLIGAPAYLHAQAAGTIARLGFGGRGLAMGNSQLADVSGYASAWYNPALAAFTQRQYASLTMALLNQDRRLEFVRYAMPLRPRAGVTVGVIHRGISGIDGRDASGFHTRFLRTREFAGFLAFGIRVSSRLTGGVALRFYYNSLHPDLSAARTLGLSVGGVYRVSSRFTLGVAIDDLLAKYVWDGLGGGSGQTSDAFPVRVRMGASYVLAGGSGRINAEYELRIRTADVRTYSVYMLGSFPVNAVSISRLRLLTQRIAWGAEYWVGSSFFVRGGIDHIGEQTLEGVVPSLGFGVEKATGDIRLRASASVLRESYGNGWAQILSVSFFL